MLALCFAVLQLLVPPSHAIREKPVRVVVPFAPGGGSDTLARILVRGINQEGLHPRPWVVINVPGAGGTIGSRRVKNARPDGNTILFLHDGILTAKFARQATYGPEAFDPVAATGVVGSVLCVAEDSPVSDLNALLDRAAEEPDTIPFAANIGAPSYFMARLVEDAHGRARFRYVQSGGGARRFADLSGGHVVASAFSVSEYLAFRGGGIRALAILGLERHPALPEVPTAREQGFEVHYENLQGWWFPRGTPPELTEETAALLGRAMELPEVREAFANQQIDPVFLDSSDLVAAVERKEVELGALGLEFEMTHLPPIEGVLVFLLLLGVVVFALGRRRPTRTPPEASSASRSVLPRIVGTGLLLVYLLALQWTESWFLPLTVAFLAVFLFLPGARTTRRWGDLAAVLAVPLLLHWLLGDLLGLSLP